MGCKPFHRSTFATGSHSWCMGQHSCHRRWQRCLPESARAHLRRGLQEQNMTDIKNVACLMLVMNENEVIHWELYSRRSLLALSNSSPTDRSLDVSSRVETSEEMGPQKGKTVILIPIFLFFLYFYFSCLWFYCKIKKKKRGKGNEKRNVNGKYSYLPDDVQENMKEKSIQDVNPKDIRHNNGKTTWLTDWKQGFFLWLQI